MESLLLKYSTPTKPGHISMVYSMSLSPDGKTLATSGEDATIRLWDVQTGEQTAILRGHLAAILTVAFSPDGKLLASGGGSSYRSFDPTIRIWDITTLKELAVLNLHSKSVRKVVFSPDGKLLASGSEDKTAKIWNIAENKQIAELKGHIFDVKSLAFSPDSKLLVTNGKTYGEQARIWDISSKAELAALENSSYATSFVFSPDAKVLIGAYEKKIKFWEVSSGKEINSVQAGEKDIYSLALSPDAKTLATGGANQYIKLWDASSAELKNTILIPSKKGHKPTTQDLAFTPDNQHIIGLSAGEIRLWRVKEENPLSNFEVSINLVQTVAFSRDGKTYASAGRDDFITIWDSATNTPITKLEDPQDWFFLTKNLEFSSDGKHLLSVHSNETVRVWDISNHQLLQKYDGEIAALSPDDISLVISLNDNSILLREIESGKELGRFIGHKGSLSTLAFSLDGKKLASGSLDGSIKIWDTSNFQEIVTFEGHTTTITSLAFSPDSKTLASSSYDKTIKLWDLESKTEIKALTGHIRGVLKVIYHPNGKLLISMGDEAKVEDNDSTIRFWDIEKGEEIFATKIEQTPGLRAIDLSPDGELLVSGHEDGSIKIWMVNN